MVRQDDEIHIIFHVKIGKVHRELQVGMNILEGDVPDVGAGMTELLLHIGGERKCDNGDCTQQSQ